MFTNGRPFTSPRSTRRSTASPKASSAPMTSSRSRPRSSAKWLKVPAGTTTKGMSRAEATLATAASEPSPAATPIASDPSAMACSASLRISSPRRSVIVAMPRLAHSRSRSNRRAFPSPDFGFTIRVGLLAGPTGLPFFSTDSGDRVSFPRAYRPSRNAIRSKPARISSCRPDVEITMVTAATNDATPRTPATRPRAPPREIEYHSALGTSAINAGTTMTRSG